MRGVRATTFCSHNIPLPAILNITMHACDTQQTEDRDNRQQQRFVLLICVALLEASPQVQYPT
jgi:hypothetical protein